MLTSAHLSPLVGSAQRSSSRWWLLHRVVFSGFRGGRRVMARGRKVGGYYLVCPLLSLICPLLFLLRFPPFLSFSFLSLPLTRIHTHVYSHSNQLRRLFFGPRHASRLLAASPARRSSPSGAATIIILVLRSRTELLSPRPPLYIYIYIYICILSRATCLVVNAMSAVRSGAHGTMIKLSLSVSLSFDLLYAVKEVDRVILIFAHVLE